MRQLLVYSRDFRTSDLVTGFLPPGWRVTSVQDAEDALQGLQKLAPDLFLLDGEFEELSVAAFLGLARERLGLLPPVILSPESGGGPPPEGVAMVVGHPLEAAEIERALAPYLIPPLLPAMRVAELLASALRDTGCRLVTFSPGGAPMSLLLGGGCIETIVHPSFRDLWRARLSGAGRELPPLRTEILEDLLFLEEALPEDDRDLLALKRSALELVLQSIPASQPLKLQERRGLSRNRLLRLPVTGFLPGLVERIPEEDLDPLRAPSVTIRRRHAADLTGLTLSPQEGFLLYQCESPVKVAHLLQSGPGPALQTLRSLFLLLLLGAVEVEPDAGDPVRLSVLSDSLERERRSILLQSTAIENLAASFQTTGLNPHQVLGLHQNASFEMAAEAHASLQERLSPEKLHPAVRQKYNRDLLFLQAKVSEAFLILQNSFMEQRQQAREGSQAEVEAHRLGNMKTDKQLVGEQHVREAERLFRYAEELYRQEQVYESTQYLKLALLHDPSLAPAHHLQGLIQSSSSAARAKHVAEKEFLEAIRLDPWEVGYLLDLAEFYLKERLPKRCQTYIEQAQKINPKEPRIAGLRAALRQLE